jgi:type IV pilus assembly protein PilA
MLATLRKRFDRDDEEGFTLIELMVVVLIIAILLAIAIPTFLGARERANHRAAQSTLRNALAAEKVFFTDNQVYTATTSDLTAIEPNLSWTGQVASASTTDTSKVYVGTASVGKVLCLQVASKSNSTVWGIYDNVGSGGQTRYYKDGDFTATCPASAPTGGSTTGFPT